MEVSKHKVVGKEKKKWFTRSKREELKEELIGYGFVLPQLILFIMFIAYPVLEGFKMSLFQQTYVDEVFVGFENYRQLFSDPVFIKSVFNTVLFVVGIVALTLIFGLFVLNITDLKYSGIPVQSTYTSP